MSRSVILPQYNQSYLKRLKISSWQLGEYSQGKRDNYTLRKASFKQDGDAFRLKFQIVVYVSCRGNKQSVKKPDGEI